MVKKNFIISNPLGLHVRPASVLVKTIQPFHCSVVMLYKESEYNTKSILGIIGAGIQCNEEVTIVCDGADEDSCMEAISQTFASDFIQ